MTERNPKEAKVTISDLYLYIYIDSKNMCHRFAVEQLVNEQISYHYEFALPALARCHAHEWKAGVCN